MTHQKAVHDKEVKYGCNICVYQSYFRQCVKAHVENNHAKTNGYLFIINLDKDGLQINQEEKNTMRYLCENCDYKSFKDKYLQRHIKLNHGSKAMSRGKILRCKLCTFETSIYNRLIGHQNAVHDKEVKYGCSICDYKSYFRSSVKNHIEKLHVTTNGQLYIINLGNGGSEINQEESNNCFNFKCTLCSFHTSNKSYFNNHEKLHNDNTDLSKLINCPSCEFQTMKYSNLNQHKRIQHFKEKRFNCSICVFKSYFSRHVSSHIKANHKDTDAKIKFINANHKDTDEKIKSNTHKKVFKCKYCPFISASTQKEILRHMKGDHPSEKLFNCDHCKYKCNLLQNLSTHKAGLHGETQLKCDICEYKTTWKTPFYLHRRKIHGIFKNNSKNKEDLELSETLCDSCGFKATSRLSMNQHKINLCGTSWTCNFCKTKLPSSHSLSSHIAIVHENKFKECTECGYKAINSSRLKAHHDIVHEKKYTNCSICGKTVSCVPRHVRVVHENKNTVCSVCQFKATTTNSLLKHKSEAHDTRNTNCTECDFKATNNYYLRTHRNKVHGTGKINYKYMKKIHPSTDINCDLCDYKASSMIILKKHEDMIHLGTKPFAGTT